MGRHGLLVVVFSLHASLASAQATVSVLPSHPSSLDPLEFAVTGSSGHCWPAVLLLDPPTIAGETITLAARTPPGPLPPGCSPGWPQTYELAALPAGSYSAEFRLDGTRFGAAAFQVVDPPPALELHNGKFAATVQFVDPRNGLSGMAHPVPLTEASGSFWFFTAGNVELTIKILDGRGVNGAYWLFIASLTNVEYTVEIERRDIVCVAAPCGVARYASPAGINRNIIDVELFAE